MAWAGNAAAAERTAFYYGPTVPADLIAVYDQIVVEPSHLANLQDFALDGVARRSQGKARPVAYLSVGEVAKAGSDAGHVQKQWVLGENPGWSSWVMDLSDEGYQAFLFAKFERLWAAGYHRFFLDTLDSYRLAGTEHDSDRAERALISIILGMKRRHPEVRLLVNRGFEILKHVKAAVSGVVAESLFDRWDAGAQRYTRVPEDDRRWLSERLRQARDVYGLPVTVIDYRPPAERDEARETARKIRALGFEPWVTDAALTSVGTGSLEILPRRVLILGNEPPRHRGAGDGTSGDDTAVPEPEPLRLLAPVLEYLGYVPEYRDAPADWSELTLDQGYRGVITWFSAGRMPPGYPSWMRAQRVRGVRFVVFGVPGFDLAGNEAKELGIQLVSPGSAEPTEVVARDRTIGFEAEPPRRPFDGPLVELGRERGTRVHLRLRDARGRSAVAIASTAWGGLALSHVLALRGVSGERAWVIDPVAFIERALALPRAPMPNVTTESGRRLAMFLVRARGLSWPVAHGRPDCATVLGEWLNTQHAWPHGVEVQSGADTDASAEDLRAAARLAELELFEPAELRPGTTRARGEHASLTQVGPMFVASSLSGPIARDSVFLPSGQVHAYPFEQVLGTLEYTDSPRRLKPVLIDYHGFMASSAAGRATLRSIYTSIAAQEPYPIQVDEYAELARAFVHQVVARDDGGVFHYFGGERLATVRVPEALGLPRLGTSGVASVRPGKDGLYVSFAADGERRLALGAKRLDRPHLVHGNGRVLRFEVRATRPERAELELSVSGHVPLELAFAELPQSARCELALDGGRVQGTTDARGELVLRLPRSKTGDAVMICTNAKGAP